MIDSFFRPFFGGIFLETELATSSRMLEFVFRMFSEGRAALPSAGMGMIPRQLAARLPAGTVRLNARVESIGPRRGPSQGRRPDSSHSRGLGDREPARRPVSSPSSHPPGFRSTACLYYAAPKDPLGKAILVLNGEGGGPVDHLCVPSAVAPTYAPAGGSPRR